MTAGEFIRQLTEKVHELGYTANNIIITDIFYSLRKEKDGCECIGVCLNDTDDNEELIYIEN